MTSKTYGYSIYHLNMAFSSITVEDRKTVIENCYWPLLSLADDHGIPLGIEATGRTLEIIDEIDPQWTKTLKKLLDENKVELIGSGFSQMIGPLVPATVTEWNLKLGNEVYDKLLNTKPKIALVNEQAYSPGLVPLYLAAGYEALVMDWADPASHHPEWGQYLGRSPARIIGTKGETISVLWSDAITFQRFQRLAHGECEEKDYFDFIKKLLGEETKALPLYTSDAEIFNYRPGRFESEAKRSEVDEWMEISKIYKSLSANTNISLCLPSKALELIDKEASPLSLETAQCPIPVKKQRKYNIARWALTGRDDTRLNTACWSIFKAMEINDDATANDWRELCWLWSSDFRTHIGDRRWKNMQSRLNKALNKFCKPAKAEDKTAPFHPLTGKSHFGSFTINNNKGKLEVCSDDLSVTLNTKRGLAITSVTPRDGMDGPSWFGTTEHGFYDDISWGADFYSGHLTFDIPGSPKITDLNEVDVFYKLNKKRDLLSLRVSQITKIGTITKTISLNLNGHKIKQTLEFDEFFKEKGNLRLGYITLNPELFSENSLFYKSHNGGHNMEKHIMRSDKNIGINHGDPVSTLVSSSFGLGLTKGEIILGDRKRAVKITLEKAKGAFLGQIQFTPVRKSYFCRFNVSALEVDDTRKPNPLVLSNTPAPSLSMTIELMTQQKNRKNKPPVS